MRAAAAALAATLLLASIGAVESAFTRTAGARADFAAAPAFAPRLLSPPVIDGTATDGETLTTTTGAWARDPHTLLVEWLRCDDVCEKVGEGTTRELTPNDVGRRMRVRVTATNAGGSTQATSVPTAEVAPLAPPQSLTAPTVTGSPFVGETLTAADGTWSGRRLAITRRWLRCTTSCVPIAGEPDPTYVVTGDDPGATIKVETTATNASGTATATSAATGKIARSAYTQFLCANPATGLGVDVDGTLPNGLRIGGTLAHKFDANPGTRCALGSAGSGVALSTGGTYSTSTPDDRIVLEYRMREATQFLGATIYRYGRTSGAWSWAIQTSSATTLFAAPRTELCSWGHGCETRGSAGDPFAAQNRVVIPMGTVDGFNITLACDIASGGRCDADGSQVVRLFGGTAILRDTETPKLMSAVSGGLTDGPLEEVEDLAFAATDAGSGVYRVRVRIDSRDVAARVVHSEQGRCADRDPANADPYEFAHRRPCPESVAASMSFDTSTWPRAGRLRVYLEDAGRNTIVLVNRVL